MPRKREEHRDRDAETLTGQVDVGRIHRQTQDIQSWRSALRMAENHWNPRRYKLYNLYHDLILDPHLSAVMQKRIMAITNSEIRFLEEGEEGEEDSALMNRIRSPWFLDTLYWMMESKFWGHSLIEFLMQNGEITDSELVPRLNVSPERGKVLYHEYGLDGIDYTTPPESNFVLEVGKQDDLGLLLKAAPYVLYKRGGFADWSQFAEIFGMPWRIGKYDPFNLETRNQLQQALANSGGATWMTIPEGANIEFQQPSNQGGSSSVYQELVKDINKELSKLILGNTMTTEDGSSRSQSETHRQVEESINMADKIWMEYMLNWHFKSLLSRHGFPVDNGRFAFDDTEKLSLDKRLDMDIKLSRVVPIDPNYFYETYGVPAPDEGADINTDPQEDPEEEPDNQEDLSLMMRWYRWLTGFFQKKKVKLSIPDRPVIPHYIQLQRPEDIEEQVLRDAQKAKEFNARYQEWLTGQLLEAFGNGYNTPSDIDYNSPHHLTQSMMEANIHKFSAAKNVAQLRQLNQVRQRVSSFSEFKGEAESVLDQYNRNYLKAEYDLARSTAQNASAYVQQVAEQDTFPYLEYQTAGDDRVRVSHKALDGRIYQVDDPALDTIYPPNGWGCRCEMIQHTEVPQGRELSNREESIAALQETDQYDRMRKEGFHRNKGQTKQIFDSNQLYLQNFDAGDLSFQSQDRKAFADMDAATMPDLPERNRDEEFAQLWFDNQRGRNDLDSSSMVRFLDHRQRPVHLKRTKLNSNNYNHLEDTPTILRDADEVYMRERGDRMFQYVYLKFYKEGAKEVRVDFQRGKPENIRSIQFTDSPDDSRQGILIKAK